MGFTKLDDAFASSSIFSLGLPVVGFWAYLLSQANAEGIVTATVPDMAARCRVTPEQIEEFLELLQKPDRWSRTPDNEGRRIAVTHDPEWAVILLNHGKYRWARDPERRREQVREAVRRHREGKPCKPGVITGNHGKPKQKTEAEAEERTNVLPEAPPPAVTLPPVEKDKGWSKVACDDWIDRYAGTAPGGQIGKHLRPLVEKHGWQTVRQAWRAYLEGTDPQYASAARFASMYGTWAPRTPYQPEAPPPEPLPDFDLGANGFFEAMKLRLSGVLPLQIHATWVRPVFGRAWDGTVLVLTCPSKEHAAWLRNHAADLRKAAEELGRPGPGFRAIVVRDEPPEAHNGSVR